MRSNIIPFLLINIACALSIPESYGDANDIQTQSAHLRKRGVTTGVKVALGLCVPAAALAVGLGLVILLMYPSQLRKLRRENPGAEVGLNELMTGKVTQQTAPPPYNANDSSAANKPSSEATDPPSYLVQPKSDSHTAPPTEPEARHAALMS